MSMKRKKNKSMLAAFRNNFIAGVVVLIPIGITVYLSIFIIKISSKILPKEINPNSYLPYEIPGVEILIAVMLITFVGWLSLSFLGKKIFDLVETILNKIPILRTIYSAVGQLTETFTKSKGDKKSVVLVEYPREGLFSVGFVTGLVGPSLKPELDEPLLSVFFVFLGPTVNFVRLWHLAQLRRNFVATSSHNCR